MRKSLFLLFAFVLFTFTRSTYGQDSIKTQLEKVYDADQNIRKDIGPLIDKYGINSPQVDSVRYLMTYIDSLNEIFMKSFLEGYGFLGKSKVGEKGIQTEWLVIQHSADLNFQKKWLPVIWKLSNESELSKEMAAILDDRIRVRSGKKQLYGTQLKWSNESNKWVLEEFDDPANVEKRRKEMGMETLDEYLKSFNEK